MTDTLVDTNVLIDLSGSDPVWREWSANAVATAADKGSVLINPIIYSEFTAGFATREDLDATLTEAGFGRENIPWDAAFAAGMIYKAYRKQGGTRQGLLPDFIIGAHAAVRGYRLLTRDRGYFASYFPSLDIISPETHP